jgi:hypothetical protein
MSKEQRRMMDDENKLLREAANPLTHLFRKILRELGIEAKPWNRRLTAFLSSPLSRVPKNAKDIGQERNNFNRAIAKKQITFKTFQKAVQILGPVRYSMSITMVMRDGREVTVNTDMFKNPYAAIDNLSSVVSGKGLDPDADIVDYNDEDDSVTDAELDKIIQQIDAHEPPDVRPVMVRPDPGKRTRLDQVLNRNLPKDIGDTE